MSQVPPAHVPVLRDRCVELLAPALSGPHSVVVDGTLGPGGHSAALLERFAGVRLIGLDRDPAALELARERLAPFADRVRLVHAVFDELAAVLDQLGQTSVHGVLLDLGVSSLQLDQADRGFAYARDAPLDMRMDAQRADSPTAADILNSYSQPELVRMLRQYGQERFAPAIARAIVRRRATQPLRRSAELVDLIRQAVPAPARRTGGNPAKRTFQALRIEVNDELGALRRVLPQAIDRLALHGRIVVLSYHSGEDAAVKSALREASSASSPPGFPVELPEHAPQLRLVIRGAEQASGTEVIANPRASSVRLRAAERVRPVPAPTSVSTRRQSGAAARDRRSRPRRQTSPPERPSPMRRKLLQHAPAGRATSKPRPCRITASGVDRRTP